jgi:hypothetical protein
LRRPSLHKLCHELSTSHKQRGRHATVAPCHGVQPPRAARSHRTGAVRLAGDNRWHLVGTVCQPPRVSLSAAPRPPLDNGERVASSLHTGCSRAPLNPLSLSPRGPLVLSWVVWLPEDGWLASWLLQTPSRNSCAHVDRTAPLIDSSTGEDFMALRRFLSLSLSVHRGVGGVSDS